jgi:nucleotide-binding universal stress UspA family protein
MAMKNVLLLVHDDAGQEARLQAALDLARALEGHLNCLDVAVMPVVVGDVYGTTAMATLIEDAQRRETGNRRRVEARLAHEDVPWTWIDALGDPAAELVAQSRLADIIVVSLRLGEALAPDMRVVAGRVMISSGRTVVAVPEDARGFAVGGHALVAFDGSAAASDALRAAVPLLALAGKVTLVEVARGADAGAVEEAATYLSRHGIRPEVHAWRSGADRVGDVLLDEIAVQQADYVVMGGYGHSRLVEDVFGGVTRQLLGESPVPLVITH